MVWGIHKIQTRNEEYGLVCWALWYGRHITQKPGFTVDQLYGNHLSFVLHDILNYSIPIFN